MGGIEPEGCLTVTLVSGNDGVLVVNRASIRSWLRAKLEKEGGRRWL
jgi:hypothetical protein